jgi:hypothetical protein
MVFSTTQLELSKRYIISAITILEMLTVFMMEFACQRNIDIIALNRFVIRAIDIDIKFK